MDKCPVCGGRLKKAMINEHMFGVDLGRFQGHECTKCGESFLNSEAMKKVEEKAKAKGVWGLGSRTKVTRTGNSLAVRIPKKLAKHLGIVDGKEAYIHPEGNKLVIEV